jgi:hypothetical protein
MQHSSQNRRQAAKLGIRLPDATTQPSEKATWSSGGQDTLYEGHGAGECRLNFVQGTWEVTLLRSHRLVGSFATLDSALRSVRYLQSKTARRAFYGAKPRQAKVSLSEALRSVNGGAVTVS